MDAGQEKATTPLPAWQAWPRCALEAILAVALFVMMVVTFIDVVGRYALNSPLSGAKELTELLLMVVVFGAAPLITASNEHITTTLFDEISSGSMRRTRGSSIAAISAIACAVLAWQCWAQGNLASTLDARTPLLDVPTAPFIYFMAVMSAACALILCVMTVEALRSHIPEHPAEPDPTI
jgi:TRAP-type C4-dicarboxylate transport system permease small subunit